MLFAALLLALGLHYGSATAQERVEATPRSAGQSGGAMAKRRERRKLTPPPGPDSVLKYRGVLRYRRADGFQSWATYRAFRLPETETGPLPLLRARLGISPALTWHREVFKDQPSLKRREAELAADALTDAVSIEESLEWAEPTQRKAESGQKYMTTKALRKRMAETGRYGRFWRDHPDWIG